MTEHTQVSAGDRSGLTSAAAANAHPGFQEYPAGNSQFLADADTAPGSQVKPGIVSITGQESGEGVACCGRVSMRWPHRDL